MGPRTAAARAEVIARRQVLADEVVRLEASTRAAVDIPAKIRKNPAKVIGLGAGVAFLVLGGPKRSVGLLRHLVLGSRADLPKSMLPKEIEKAVKALGSDGNRVRGVLEREFANYLEKSKPDREKRSFAATLTEIGGSILRPVSAEAGRRMARELFKPDGGAFDRAVESIRARRDETAEALAAERADAEAAERAAERNATKRGRRKTPGFFEWFHRGVHGE
jgi:hypothetical protein